MTSQSNPLPPTVPSTPQSTASPTPGPRQSATDRIPSLIHTIRRRVLAMSLGVSIAAVATISLLSLPVWPVVGVAVATIAWAVNSMTARLTPNTCWGCGTAIAQSAPAGEYGVICHLCGTINQTRHASRTE